LEGMLIGNSASIIPLRFGRFTGGTINAPTTINTDMVISQTGNVGVGTNTPTEKLDVNGNITLSGQIIQDPWQNATLLNGWVYFGAPFATAQNYKDKEGVVHVKGLIASGSTIFGTVLFNLPAGYRQTERRIMIGLTNGIYNGVPTRIDVSANGDVLVVGSNADNSWLNMEFSFRP